MLLALQRKSAAAVTAKDFMKHFSLRPAVSIKLEQELERRFQPREK
jgi:hypothetical protein